MVCSRAASACSTTNTSWCIFRVTICLRRLPIGNLSVQFWSNCHIYPFDQFVTRELRCPAYLRYVDDFALFSDSKRELWAWKRSRVKRLDEHLAGNLAGHISFGEFDASVKGWVNHIRYADSWGLRRHVFRGLRFRPRPGHAATYGLCPPDCPTRGL